MTRHFQNSELTAIDQDMEIGEALSPLPSSLWVENPRSAPVQTLELSAGVLADLGPAGPILGTGGTSFDVATFASNIRQALDGNCVGYSFAVNQGGKLARKGAGGFRQLRQDPDDNIPMRAKKRMHTASVSKNITATAVMKAMADRGISPNAKVRDFLPSQWSVHQNLGFLKLKHLLRHRSGFDKSGADPHYNSLRDVMENLTDWNPDFDPDTLRYDNRNFGLFRILLPYMVCPQVMSNVEATGWAAGNYHAAVDQATQDYYKFLVRHYVFNPLGLKNMECAPNTGNAKRTMCYMWPNPLWSQGRDGGDKSDEAGGEGWVMSVTQLARFLRLRRYSNAFLDASLRSDMDSERYGWLSINGDQGTYLRHGGAYGGCVNGAPVPGSGPLRASIMQFPIHVEAAVLVNSFVTNCGNSLDRLIANAFDAAYV